jgi:hypothetical protein
MSEGVYAAAPPTNHAPSKTSPSWIRRIHAVVANGRLFDRPALDRLLEGVAENAARM